MTNNLFPATHPNKLGLCTGPCLTIASGEIKANKEMYHVLPRLSHESYENPLRAQK